jgi:cyclohexyl-isocyanide hydratase
MSMDLLRHMGIEASNERVVVDQNRITGAGVTSGIDFALTLASILYNEQFSREIQLQLEYNPKPPFNDGHPDLADAAIVSRVMQQQKELMRGVGQ